VGEKFQLYRLVVSMVMLLIWGRVVVFTFHRLS
jgi:hypothetical protein